MKLRNIELLLEAIKAFRARWLVQEELKNLFKREVDLVTRSGIENSRNPYRRETALSTAKVIRGIVV